MKRAEKWKCFPISVESVSTDSECNPEHPISKYYKSAVRLLAVSHYSGMEAWGGPTMPTTQGEEVYHGGDVLAACTSQWLHCLLNPCLKLAMELVKISRRSFFVSQVMNFKRLLLFICDVHARRRLPMEFCKVHCKALSKPEAGVGIWWSKVWSAFELCYWPGCSLGNYCWCTPVVMTSGWSIPRVPGSQNLPIHPWQHLWHAPDSIKING